MKGRLQLSRWASDSVVILLVPEVPDGLDGPFIALGLAGLLLKPNGWSAAAGLADAYSAGGAAYSSSLTCSPQLTGLPDSSTSCIAMWIMKRSGAAPCQCSSPGSK
jgi:hypothetical protein